MCGIIGSIGILAGKELVENGLKVMKNRGIDSTKVLEINEHIFFGHNLHSIIDLVEQPLESEKGVLVINCEIYNWKELSKKHGFNSRNDSELVLQILDAKINSGKEIDGIVNELDGDFAFAYYSKKLNKLFLARDSIGVKPLVYFFDSKKNHFVFASEKKALIVDSLHLNPRKIAVYDLSKKKLDFIDNNIAKTTNTQSKSKSFNLVLPALQESVKKRIPDKKFALLLSGGIDSALIGKILQKNNAQFGCYFAAIKDLSEPKDLAFAQLAAKEIGSHLSQVLVTIENYESALPKIISLIESTDPIRVGVASTIYFATKLASEEGCKVVISGLGADELFAGYSRFKNSTDINKDCYSYLIKMYENDLYFEDIITMNNMVELRVPFLDKNLASISLKLDSKYKMDKKTLQNKKILRDIALNLGLSSEIALRPKKAAQYGSNFDKALEVLAKKNNFKSKADYLNSLAKDASFMKRNIKLGALVSTGKDSLFALHLMEKQGYSVPCMISIDSKNKDSFMFHTPTMELAALQAEALGKKLILVKTAGDKEKELNDLKKAMMLAKKKFGIEGIISGALFSNYQRERIEKICEDLGIRHFAPLWHMNQTQYLRNLVDNGFVAIITRIAGAGLDEKWLGREIDSSAINDLIALEKKYQINVAGEGGEYESLVLDAPSFKKKIVIEKSEKVVLGENTGYLVIKKVKLVKK